jgi:transposase-like protein
VLFINVKIRDRQIASRPIYVVLAVTAVGERDILGLWAGEHGDMHRTGNRYMSMRTAGTATSSLVIGVIEPGGRSAR